MPRRRHLKEGPEMTPRDRRRKSRERLAVLLEARKGVEGNERS